MNFPIYDEGYYITTISIEEHLLDNIQRFLYSGDYITFYVPHWYLMKLYYINNTALSILIGKQDENSPLKLFGVTIKNYQDENYKKEYSIFLIEKQVQKKYGYHKIKYCMDP